MSRRTDPTGANGAILDIGRAQHLAVQLEALLTHAYGSSGDAFRCLSDQLQDAYLWAAGSLASELVASLDAHHEAGGE